MKKFLIAAGLVLCSWMGYAQKYVPQITTGTVLNYTAYARAFDKSLPAVITVTDINDPLKLKWSVPGMGAGVFQISAKAIQSGKKMAIKEPGLDDVTKLKDDETLAFLSKDTFASLVNDKAFELNGQKFNVTADTAPFTINGKEADVFYAVTANGKTKLWILNNPDFPLICKMQGGPHGIDLSLDSLQ